MLKIKLFDEPIKTEGYCEGVDLFDLFDNDVDGYLLLKYKYKHETDFEEDIVKVEYDFETESWIFENDYWEGQEEVYIMGYMNHHYNWTFQDILTIMKLSTKNDILISTIKQLKERNKELKTDYDNLKDEIEYLIYLYDYKLNDKLDSQMKKLDKIIDN